MTEQAKMENLQAILNSSSYKIAYRDLEFISLDALRPQRLELELLKPEMFLTREGITETIVTFGGTQILEEAAAEEMLEKAEAHLLEDPTDKNLQREVDRSRQRLKHAHYYDECRQFAQLVAQHQMNNPDCNYVIATGGGPGIMEAANRGAFESGAKSIGLNITLPFEQVPNAYITPGLCFQFNYFALRKMHFLFRAKALVCFPGGYGTLDELFTALTLRQTQRMQKIPIILYGSEYWKQAINFQFLADQCVIRDEHVDLVQYADTPQEAWQLIWDFHSAAKAAE